VKAIDGHVVAKDADSQISLQFAAGEPTYIKGYIYGDGEISLGLQNDSAWYHENRGGVLPAGFTGSHLNVYNGGWKSKIFQRDDRPITIDEIWSRHLNVVYEHDAAAPQRIKGGDIVIKQGFGVDVALITDSAGLNTSPSASRAEKNLVSATLSALAGKLRYTDYDPKVDAITGNVQISEGLTNPSVRLEHITFDAATGRGKAINNFDREGAYPDDKDCTVHFVGGFFPVGGRN